MRGGRRRVDANQPTIIAALRAVGASVQPIYMVGAGVPDLLVARGGCLYLLEVKTLDGRLTDDERRWHAAWGGPVAVVRTVDEALRAVGVEVQP